ncbi:DUF4129 domain-containing protein [Natrinema salaciae]|uniref:DUF4129 domain-containing protein n=1 Tax=Natrinema salaciae TaxID=1186196 RepID=A0A1H9BXG2_9EURY|nr:DUF4129 domain-containing protein [Natrinema salaciae]SEP93431.1 hypothetical protein SAMN04489841_0883 [Natrinema salaciae]
MVGDGYGRTLLALLLVSIAVGGGIATVNATSAADGGPAQRVAAQQSESDDDPNETQPHRNPDEYAEDGDLESLEGWLSDRMTTRLEEGAIRLREGEYEAAGGYVGEDYRERLGQYVNITEMTDGDSYDERFDVTGEQQARLSDAVREYRETKAEYEAAREAGDDRRARELARDLETLADEIDSLGGSVRGNYDDLEAGTDANLTEADAAIENVTEEIRTEQAAVREQEFEETELSLEPEREEISFLEPLAATGELRTANGSPIANEEITLEIGNRTERFTTNSTGEFTLEYRPIDEPLDAEKLSFRYVPDPQSTYLGDETNVSVSIEQVEPTVELSETPSEVSYGETHAVTGELHADGVPVDGVPLTVSLDGERIGNATVRDGAFETAVAVPASVDDGDRELRVRLPFEDRALAATANTTGVRVLETETELSIEGDSAGEREITVNGTLSAAGSDGVEGEDVQLRIDGAAASTVTTGSNGTFADTVAVPDSVDANDVTVTAVYEARDTNLESATAETAVTIDEADSQLSTVIRLGGGFLVVIAAGLGIWWYRRSDGMDAPVGSANDRGSADDGAIAAVEPLLERASEHLENGQPSDAARTGYAAVRRVLASRIDGQEALTHWEFYRAYREEGDADADSLHTLTTAYERAAFDRDRISPADAASALETARRLCEVTTSDGGGGPADDSRAVNTD